MQYGSGIAVDFLELRTDRGEPENQPVILQAPIFLHFTHGSLPLAKAQGTQMYLGRSIAPW